MRPKVSVVLPVYNGENTIYNTLESLALQSFKDFELIVCIDGSKDKSKTIVRSFEDNFSSLKIIENEKNLGIGATMNRLVSETRGEYIAVAEQDDFYYSQRIELQVEILDENDNIGLVSGIAEFWDGEKVTFRFPGILVENRKYPKGKEMFLLNYREQMKVVNSCMMFRKSTHVDQGLYFSIHYPNIPVDWAYILRFSLVSEIYGLNRVLVRLDRRKERQSVTIDTQRRFLGARELIRSFAFEYPNVISEEDFKYAKRTQLLLESSQYMGSKFIFYSIFLMVRYSTDRRFRVNIKKRVKIKLLG